ALSSREVRAGGVDRATRRRTALKLKWADPILRQPYEVKDGLLHIPGARGIGLEWNEDAVMASRADF
ncbi:MAG: hypothetical protein WB685_13770, partial [Pseudolabrys sp.]